MINSQDELLRAFVIIQALRKNIGEMNKNKIQETFVNEYHTALDKLINLGIDVVEFKIPSSEITTIPAPSIITIQPGQSMPKGPYTKEKYVERTFFLTKIDAVLGYFEFLTSPEKKRIGFHKPEK
jgi:hypothetical protein